MFMKILIANRGEIACRIIKTLKKMGIRSVALYTTADRDSLHVSLADEAYWIGEGVASESYLDAEKILEIAFTCKGLAWTKLDVLETWQGGVGDKVGKVLFRASFVQEGKEGLHSEHSRFKRFGKAWMYVDGDMKG